MNDLHRPSQRQLAYLRYCVCRAHGTGAPYLPIEYLGPKAVSVWIE